MQLSQLLFVIIFLYHVAAKKSLKRQALLFQAFEGVEKGEVQGRVHGAEAE